MRIGLVLLGIVVAAGPAAADSYTFDPGYPDHNPWHGGILEFAGSIGHRTTELAGVSEGWQEASVALAWRKKRGPPSWRTGSGSPATASPTSSRRASATRSS